MCEILWRGKVTSEMFLENSNVEVTQEKESKSDSPNYNLFTDSLMLVGSNLRLASFELHLDHG